MIRQSRVDRKVAFCILLLCMNLVFIWGNSLLPGDASGALSTEVKKWILSLLPGLSGVGGDKGHNLLRKLAHFTEFCCLGICLRCLVRLQRKTPVRQHLLPWFWGVLAACADETIQCFVPDRGPALTDVGIDVLGVTLGVGVISLVYFLKEKKNQSNLEENDK